VFICDYLSAPPTCTIEELVYLVKKKRLELHYDAPRALLIDAKYGVRRPRSWPSSSPPHAGEVGGGWCRVHRAVQIQSG